MKTYFALFLAIASVLAPTSRAATVNWSGTLVVDPQVNINSNTIALTAAYTFALGSFNDTFTPTENNLNQWATNFKVFDVAAYNNSNGYFGSTAYLEEDGSRLGKQTDSPLKSPPETGATGGSLVDYTTVFAGKKAYLWVFNTTATGSASWEWALVRSKTWTFPSFDTTACCDVEAVMWSVGDIVPTTADPTNAVLVYGGANNKSGPGTYGSTPTTFQIQTAVPEPGGAFLAALGGAIALLRRRRHA